MPISKLRLLVPDASRLAESAVPRAYMIGPDQIPWHDRFLLSEGELVVERMAPDSARLCVPWKVDGHGEVVLCTGTLMQRARPYHLPVELARGKLNVIRTQIADWEALGLVVPAQVPEKLRSALRRFAAATTLQHDPPRAADEAQLALGEALDVADMLTGTYLEQALSVRHRQVPRLPTLLGVVLGSRVPQGAIAQAILEAFNSATVNLSWRSIEAEEDVYKWDVVDQQLAWCAAQKLHASGGPILRLDDQGMPDWLALWEGDYDGIATFASDYVAQVVRRYKGRVASWQCAARVNVGSAFSLSEDQRLRLAVRAIEITRRYDPDTPVILRFDQPWFEYMRRGEADRCPLHFVDDLIRAGLPISGIGLDINVGYSPDGTSHRDRLDYSRMLDYWTCLGLPLHLFLAVPSDEAPDPLARGRSTPQWGVCPGGWSPGAQAAWVDRFVPLLLAKVAVASITWAQLSDSEPHDWPHGGLFDAGGAPKPTLARLAALRKKHLA